MNQKIHPKEYLDIDIHNMEVSMSHWGNERGIQSLAETVDMATIDANDVDFENRIFNILLNLSKENSKIEKIIFYNDFTYLIISNVRTFAPENFLKRSIQITHKKANRKILINEITTQEFEEIEEGKKTLPAEWTENQDLTNKFETYRSLFLT
jgi:hypothetical protein